MKILMVLLWILQSVFGVIVCAAELPKLVASGEWSKPVTDSRGHAIRGRMVLCEKPVRDDCREVAVYVELQDATESVGRSVHLYCDLGKHDFRPEYKSGLQCELRDKDDRRVPSAPFAFSGAIPKSEWVTLPSDSTIRLRASPFSVYRPGAMAICPQLGSLWIIRDEDPNEYFLSGMFAIIPPDNSAPPSNEHVWTGTIELPPVCIVNKHH